MVTPRVISYGGYGFGETLAPKNKWKSGGDHSVVPKNLGKKYDGAVLGLGGIFH